MKCRRISNAHKSLCKRLGAADLCDWELCGNRKDFLKALKLEEDYLRKTCPSDSFSDLSECG